MRIFTRVNGAIFALFFSFFTLIYFKNFNLQRQSYKDQPLIKTQQTQDIINSKGQLIQNDVSIQDSYINFGISKAFQNTNIFTWFLFKRSNQFFFASGSRLLSLEIFHFNYFMIVQQIVYNFRSKQKDIVQKTFFYNKLIFPQIPNEPQTCQGQYSQTIYREISVMIDQVQKDSVCLVTLELYTQSTYGKFHFVIDIPKNPQITFQRKLDQSGKLFELQSHQFFSQQNIKLHFKKESFFDETDQSLDQLFITEWGVDLPMYQRTQILIYGFQSGKWIMIFAQFDQKEKELTLETDQCYIKIGGNIIYIQKAKLQCNNGNKECLFQDQSTEQQQKFQLSLSLQDSLQNQISRLYLIKQSFSVDFFYANGHMLSDQGQVLRINAFKGLIKKTKRFI